jgi:hypothetical protein
MTDSLEQLFDRQERYAVTYDNRKPPRPILPKLPDRDDVADQADWITAILNLDWDHKIVRGRHSGLEGGLGHVQLDRIDAKSLHLKPASRISNGQHLNDDLVWQLIRADGELHPWSNQQANKIAQVIGWFCESSALITSEQQTAQIITTYMDGSDEILGCCTYGTPGERYEAAVALRSFTDEYGRLHTRYLIDEHSPNGSEIVIRVSDLARTARAVLGSSIQRGWLDAQIEEFGDFTWERVELQGQSIGGREGRAEGRHTSPNVYRGPLSTVFKA